MGKIQMYNQRRKEGSPIPTELQDPSTDGIPGGSARDNSGAINFIQNSKLLRRILTGSDQTSSRPLQPAPREVSQPIRGHQRLQPTQETSQRTIWQAPQGKNQEQVSPAVNAEKGPSLPSTKGKLPEDALTDKDPLFSEVATRVKAKEGLELRPPQPEAFQKTRR